MPQSSKGAWFHSCAAVLVARSHNAHSNFVNCVRYSPDGAWFASAGSDSKLCLYEGKEGEFLKEFAKPDGVSGSFWAMAWSPDSARCATAGGDKKLRIWDREAGAQVAEATVGTALADMQVGVSWASPSRVVSVCLDGRLLLWDVTSGLSLAGTINGTQGPLSCLACDKKSKSPGVRRDRGLCRYCSVVRAGDKGKYWQGHSACSGSF